MGIDDTSGAYSAKSGSSRKARETRKAHELCSCRPRAFAETVGCVLLRNEEQQRVNVKALGIFRGLSFAA